MAQETASPTRYAISLVSIPEDWKPLSWFDRPGTIKKLEDACILTKRCARMALRGFNRTELRDRRNGIGQNLWLVADAAESGNEEAG